MQSIQDVTGRWHHTFRQSDISEFHMCPEKLRTAPEGDNATDATLVGTALHESVELWLESDGEASADDCRELALQVLADGWEAARHVQMDSVAEARTKLMSSFGCFWENRHHFPLGGVVESRFYIENIWTDPSRTISFTGTPDYFHPKHNAVFDWKTNAQSYHKDFWRTQRYAVQPTMYCMAAEMMTGEIPSFTFVRFPKDGTPMEMATVERTHADFRALVHQALGLAQLIEAKLPAWPMRPTDWHCSPKWCDTFRSGDCMGSYLAGESWSAPWMDETDDQLRHLQINLKGNHE